MARHLAEQHVKVEFTLLSNCSKAWKVTIYGTNVDMVFNCKDKAAAEILENALIFGVMTTEVTL